ncbi:MAG TPA: beta-ketoacyl-[acyl-carrier-protein] synthase family protein [Gemmataceae bacterium]|nr:beta-ketoacyl-[acyl-carrier-protein] synthase family protein [Gemmataceae bacterium]
MPASRRTVLTGVGLITPLGRDLGTFWAALAAGRGGVRRITSFDPSALPAQIGGEVDDFDAKNYVEKKDRKRLNQMARTVQFAVAAARLALQDGAADCGRLDRERVGVVLGTGTIPGDLADLGPAAQATVRPGDEAADMRRWGADGLPLIAPAWMLGHVPNMPASYVSILNDLRGPNNTITQTDVASLLALAEARRTVLRGRADLMLAGGADAKINPVTLVRHCLFSELSRHPDPARACRPFDRRRDGTAVGEGGGVLLVEELEHARRRGARIYAEVVGCGAAFDRGRTGQGLARAVRAALAEAGVGPDELDHVNAQGYGSRAGDVWEARGLQEGLAGRPVPVFAAKGYFGNLGPAAGAVELAASVLAGTHGILPATLNCDEPDPECPVAVSREVRRVERPYFLKVACTELGQCAAVVCRRWGEA